MGGPTALRETLTDRGVGRTLSGPSPSSAFWSLFVGYCYLVAVVLVSLVRRSASSTMRGTGDRPRRHRHADPGATGDPSYGIRTVMPPDS